jgi:signal peptidase I
VADETTTTGESTGEVAAPTPSTKPKHQAHGRSFLHELPFLVAIALVLALLIKSFLIQAFYIPSGSMEQTLAIGDRVLVNKVPYHWRGPKRGEIVVFNGLDNFDEGVTFAPPSNPVSKALRKVGSLVGFAGPNEKDYIKRVIGVPGDRVMCCDSKGKVVVTTSKGQVLALDEPYVYDNDTGDNRYFCAATAKPGFSAGRQQACPVGAPGVLVPPGRLWVMGDHRGNSADSRAHMGDAHQGTVPADKVVGRAFTVVYPFGHARLLKVPSTFHAFALPATPYLLGAVGALPVAALRRRRR